MTPRKFRSAEAVAQIVRQSLEEGKLVEIEGLGVFRPSPAGDFEFEADCAPRAFIAYADEEFARADALYSALAEAGIRPWLDKRHLLAGQNWPKAIERAISISDFFIPCFSRRAAAKRGQFQSELRYALDCAARIPLDEIFIIPVRLDACQVPREVCQRFHYVDLFPSWDKGVKRVIRAIWTQVRARRRLLLAS
jgi:hypothetical protein